jgi:sulfur carrier protein
MQVMVNGERNELPEGSTVSRLLERLGIAPERVVVEVNLAILKRAQHHTAVLKEGDQVEIVHFVGGGSESAQGSRLEAGGKCLQLGA